MSAYLRWKKPMKKLISLVFLLSAFGWAQNSDVSYRGAFSTSTCSNAGTSCSNSITNAAFPPNISAAASAFEVPTKGYSVATVTVSGTYAGVTVNFEFSDDGGNTYYSNTCTRTDLPVQEVSEALASNASRSWDCGVSGSTSLRVRQSAYSSGTANIGITLTAASIEPAPTIAIQGLQYTAITTATNTQISSTPRYVHTIVITQPGATSNAITVVDTTASNCSGGTTIATIPSAQLASGMAPNTIVLDITTTNGLCITTAGTTSPQLVVTYR